MRDPLLEKLVEMAIGIAKLFGVEETAEELIEEVVDIIERSNMSLSGGWALPELEDVDSAEVLQALRGVLGDDHPVCSVMQYQESSAGAMRIEVDLGTVLWEAASKKYPPQLMQAMYDGDIFAPESFGAKKPRGKSHAPVPPDAFLGSAFCNVVFMSFCEAALGDRDGLLACRSLLELVVRDFVFPVGFKNGGRTVLVPVKG